MAKYSEMIACHKWKRRKKTLTFVKLWLHRVFSKRSILYYDFNQQTCL